MLHPMLNLRLITFLVGAILGLGKDDAGGEESAGASELGRSYAEGEAIFAQGDTGDCMFVILGGQVEILHEKDGHEICFAILEKNDSFGEMAIFEDFTRTTTARAITPVRVLTVDRKTLMRKFHEDPSMVYRIMHVMARRITLLAREVVRLNIDRLATAGDLIKIARGAPKE
jgi:CRP-like cAMP-binding protein